MTPPPTARQLEPSPLPPQTAAPRWVGRTALGLAAVAIVWRLALVWHFLPQPVATENMRVGFALATRGAFADPFILPTGPTAHVAPMYPALIGTFGWLTGDLQLGHDLARSTLVVLLGLVIAWLPRGAGKLGLDPRAGLVAAAWLTPSGIPVFAWTEGSGQHEAVLTFTLLVVLGIETIARLLRDRMTTRSAVALGVAWGLAAYTSPLLLTGLGALGVASWLRERRAPMLRSLALLATCAAAAQLPWTLRTWHAVGTVALVRDNFWLELAVSNADDATADMRENMQGAGSMTRHPFLDSTAARRMASMGERAYYAQAGREARAWISAHPHRFAGLTARRLVRFAFPRLGMEHHAVFYLFTWVGGVVGFVLVLRRDAGLAWALGALLVGFAAPHLVVQGHARYSYPVLWIPLLLASSACVVVLDRWRPATRRAG